jgi:hypothetical protein
MTRRRVLCGLLLALAVLAGFAGWLWVTNGRKMTRARFEQVKEGMTREEVIRTVGGPPNDYAIAERYVAGGIARLRYDEWLCDDGQLLVLFDDADTATDVIVNEFEPLTLTDQIRLLLGL